MSKPTKSKNGPPKPRAGAASAAKGNSPPPVKAGAGEVEELRRVLRERDLRITKLRQRAAALERRLARAESSSAEAAAPASGQPALAAGSPPPFFIVGQAKSGTSWVMRLLEAHPEVMARGEGRFVGRSYKRPDLKRIDSATLQPSSLQRALLDADYLRAWIERSVWTREGDTEAALEELVGVCTRHIMHRALEGSGKRLVGDKTPFLGADAIVELASHFDDSQVIHVIRDGRDVAVSAMHHLWNHPLDLGGGLDLSSDESRIRERYRKDPQGFLESGKSIFTERRILALASAWQSNVSRAIANGRDLLADRYTEVRYERLVGEPIAETQRLLAAVGADARPNLAARCVERARFERFSGGRPVGTEDSTAFTRKGIVGDWMAVFTERDRRLFEEEAGELLTELGYSSG